MTSFTVHNGVAWYPKRCAGSTWSRNDRIFTTDLTRGTTQDNRFLVLRIMYILIGVGWVEILEKEKLYELDIDNLQDCYSLAFVNLYD